MRTTVIALGLSALAFQASAQQPPPESERRVVNVAPAKPLPKDVAAALAAANAFTLYSLDPDTGEHPDAPKTFHGWRVLGETRIADADTCKRVATTITDSVARTDGLGAKCFIPHHGLRFSAADQTYELVICFMCGHLDIYTTGQPPRYSRISVGAEVLDTILTANKVPMAERPKFTERPK